MIFLIGMRHFMHRWFDNFSSHLGQTAERFIFLPVDRLENESMGNKILRKTGRTLDDWAFGNFDHNFERREFTIGKSIEQSRSIARLYEELLTIDYRLRRLFRRSKTKNSTPNEFEFQRQSEENFSVRSARFYYQRRSKTIVEERESQLSPSIRSNSSSINVDRPSFRHCRFCSEKNMSNEVFCRNCGFAETKF